MATPLAFRADHPGAAPIGELAIGRGVVRMRMRVEDEQPVTVRMRVTGQPFLHDRIDGPAQRTNSRVRGSTGIEQEGPGSPEEEEHERRFVADRHVLTQDVGVLVARVDLDVGIGVVLGGFRSVNPRDVQVRDGGTVGKADLARYCHLAFSAHFSGAGTAASRRRSGT